MDAPLHLPIRTQELLTLSTLHPARTPSWGTAAVGGLLDSLQHTSEFKKVLLLGDSEAFPPYAYQWEEFPWKATFAHFRKK